LKRREKELEDKELLDAFFEKTRSQIDPTYRVNGPLLERVRLREAEADWKRWQAMSLQEQLMAIAIEQIVWALVAYELGIIAQLAQASAAAGRISRTPTGQIHHPISTRVGRALDSHPTLRGQFQPRDPRFTTRAIDEAAHRGYPQWHRDLDAEVVRWINDPANARATPQQFLDWLRQRYNQPDLRARFPNGF
jgi:hypothetical protein